MKLSIKDQMEMSIKERRFMTELEELKKRFEDHLDQHETDEEEKGKTVSQLIEERRKP